MLYGRKFMLSRELHGDACTAIRQRNGKVKRVTLGDHIAQRTVKAIGPDRVILSRGDKIKTLTMPKG